MISETGGRGGSHSTFPEAEIFQKKADLYYKKPNDVNFAAETLTCSFIHSFTDTYSTSPTSQTLDTRDTLMVKHILFPRKPRVQ